MSPESIFPSTAVDKFVSLRSELNRRNLIYIVTKQIPFCYGHRLLDYDGKCAHPHGHNGLAEIELSSDSLDPRGMVADFGDIKKVMKEWIDEKIDHKMILRRDDPLVPLLQELQEPLFLVDTNPTAETIARLLYDQALAAGFPVTQVTLWETANSFAVYRKS
ncbi:MAG: 6-carboxytetrahydropterin synthase [Planctomycetota bacterium]|nr:6-carboxytetrahydropterin synthase [Planctomycetota bacterium]